MERFVDGLYLPKTIKKAIAITRTIDLWYLWTYALYILQGSDDAAIIDWETNSEIMGEIYTNARATITATGAEHIVEGIFHIRGNQIQFEHHAPAASDYVYDASRQRTSRSSIFDEPLYK